MILVGAGGHAAVVLDALTAQGITVHCFIDADESLTDLDSIPVFSISALADSDELDWRDHDIIVCVGSSITRRKLVTEFNGSFGRAIHPSAVIANSVDLGVGTVVLHQSVIQARAQIGNHVIVNTAATVDHDCTIGDFVHIAPQVTVCGGVSIRNGVELGAAATVIPGITVGEGAVIGAGSVVINDIPANAVAVGSPARIIRQRDLGD